MGKRARQASQYVWLRGAPHSRQRSRISRSFKRLLSSGLLNRSLLAKTLIFRRLDLGCFGLVFVFNTINLPSYRSRKFMMAGSNGLAYAFWEKMAGKIENQAGCRPERVASDTAETAATGWPREDRIRWVEWRVRELTIKGGKYVDERGRWLLEETNAGGRKFRWKDQDELTDYAVWLLKYRDSLSWHELAYRFFPAAMEDHIEGQESKIRRAYNRVERKFKPARFSKQEKLVIQAVMLGAVPIPVGTAPDVRRRELRESKTESDSSEEESTRLPSQS